MLQRTIDFVAANPECFERSLLTGHITGSAWVLDSARDNALLVFHRKLGKWLQPGGHTDGSADVLAAALREVKEETGLTATPLSAEIFDVDAHEIPARGTEPAHIHYDVRFLVEAPRHGRIVVSPESRAVEWVRLGDIASRNTDDSVLRMVERTRARFKVSL